MEFEKKIRKIRETGSEKCKEGVQERLTLLFKEGKERKGFHFLRYYKCLFLYYSDGGEEVLNPPYPVVCFGIHGTLSF